MPLGPTFPELASLDLFVSVIELGSLSRAAAAHGIAQPSASSRIKHLERQIGMQLLDRSPTGSTPTDAGVLVAGWARSTLRPAYEFEASLSALVAEQAGRLRIVASYTIAEYLLPQWLGQFMREHPQDSVALDVANSATVVARIERDQSDIGFIETPTRTPSLHEQKVAEDQLVTVVGPTHPWTTRRRIPVEALAATPLVTREAGSGTRAALVEALGRLDLGPPTSVLELGSTSAVRAAVTHGNAPTVISRLAVAAELEAGSLVEIAVDGLDIRRDLRAVWSTRHALSPLATSLLGSLPSG